MEVTQMNARERELRQRRNGLLDQARAMLEDAEKGQRDLTDEERGQYDALMANVDALNKDIERVMRFGDEERKAIKPEPASKIGMSEGETQRYSILRAIRAMDAARRGDPNAWAEAGLELEASRAVAAKVGREPRGFFVPMEWQEKRDLQKGDPAYGGYMVATELMSQSFIELLRNKLMVVRAGATVMGDLVGDVDFPKQTAAGTGYWIGEGGAPTESTQTVGQVSLRPRTVGAYTDITRRLMKQASMDVEAFVRNDLAQIIALKVDYASLHGSGAANEPLGIASTTGIGSVAGGTNGLAPTWAHMVSLETEVAQDNADVGRLAYMSNAKVRGKLKATMRTATYGEIPIWNDMAGNTPVNGYNFHVTNQVSSTLTKGSSSGVCSAIFFGNWADLIIGQWGVLDILVDPYTSSTTGAVRIVALQDVDVAVRHAESFAAMLDALTS